MKRALSLIILLAACQAEEPPVQLGGMSSVEEMACLGQGGTVGIGGLAGVAHCVMPMADAGQSCTTGASCDGGLCLASGGAGKCVPRSPFFGCHEVVEDGVVVTLCLD